MKPSLTTLRLPLITFLSGIAVMVLELLGSRIFAPYLGSALFVWTSLIGVILGSLSLGYWLGGWLADRTPRLPVLARLLSLASLSILLLAVIKSPLLSFIQAHLRDIRLSAVLGAILLFALPSCLFGTVSPYVVKLRLQNLNRTGSTAGNLAALSTLGSIIGTFAAGFLLIPWLGTNQLLILLALFSLLTALLADWRDLLPLKVALLAVLLFLLSTGNLNHLLEGNRAIHDFDTTESRVWIYDSHDPVTARPERSLITDADGTQSAMFLDGDDLVFDYTKFYDLADLFQPNIERGLMIGGGAFSYPKHFLSRYQTARLDVVEIDPKITALAGQYFNLHANPRLQIFTTDGRLFLNQSQTRYSVIYLDAFHGHSIPFQLTTTEAVTKMANQLDDHGLILANVIGSLTGPNSRFIQAEVKTFQAIFPTVLLFPVKDAEDPTLHQNIMLVASKLPHAEPLTTTDQALKEQSQHRWFGSLLTTLPILTDDHAPVDYYLAATH